MAFPTEDDHFRPGIAALRVSRADDRIVLIFDVWHPNLMEQERRDITSLLEAVSAQRGAVAQSLLRLARSQK